MLRTKLNSIPVLRPLPVHLTYIGLSVAVAFSYQARQPEDLFREAVSAQQSGDFTVAIRDYQALLKLQPNSADVRANLGAALAHLTRYDEAIVEYRSALKLDPANNAIKLNLALAYYKKGDCQGALAVLRELRHLNSADTRIGTLLGDCEVRLGHPDEAAQLIVPLAASNPDNLDLAYVAGTALIRSGKRRDGLAFIEKVAQQGNSADAYLLAGATWLDMNEFDPARHDLEAALKLNPNLPGIHTLLGEAFDKSGNQAAAEPELRRALELNADDFQANLYLGAILYKRRDISSARPYLERAIKIDPSSAIAHYELGMLEAADNHLDAGAANLESASKQDPKWLEPHVQLAALYYKMHRRADGAKEREIVDRLTAEQQREGPK